MPIHVQHAIRATAPAGASDVFNPGASRPAPGPALWSRLHGRLAKTKAMAAMAIGLALASLAAALPAQAAPPTPSEIAVARGCAVGMVCVYASKAVFDDIKTTEPLSKITYSSSDSAFAYMKRPDGTAAGSVYAFPLSGMIGTNPARYIFNNTDKQISYITYLLLKPTKNIQRTYYYSSIDGSSSETV